MEKATHDLSQTLISSPLFIIYANHCDLLHFLNVLAWFIYAYVFVHLFPPPILAIIGSPL